MCLLGSQDVADKAPYIRGQISCLIMVKNAWEAADNHVPQLFTSLSTTPHCHETIVSKSHTSVMQHAAEICGWSYDNKVNINTKKIKEMLLGSVSKDPPPVITINSSPVERVQSFKSLGVLLTSSLSWSEHITAVCTKASKRLYFVKLLKRSGMTSDDLLSYYKTVIRPVTEYVCAVWHSSITAEQRDQLETIQRRAVRIIFGKEMDFDILAIIYDIPLLADRRDRQMRQLFNGMHDSSHCLHRLLLKNYVDPAIHTLHNHKNCRVPFARTSRFKNSFLLYALRNFQ